MRPELLPGARNPTLVQEACSCWSCDWNPGQQRNRNFLNFPAVRSFVFWGGISLQRHEMGIHVQKDSDVVRCGCLRWLHSQLVKTNTRFAEQKLQRGTWESCWVDRCDFGFGFPFFQGWGQVCIMLQNCVVHQKVLVTCRGFHRGRNSDNTASAWVSAEHTFLSQKDHLITLRLQLFHCVFFVWFWFGFVF